MIITERLFVDQLSRFRSIGKSISYPFDKNNFYLLRFIVLLQNLVDFQFLFRQLLIDRNVLRQNVARLLFGVDRRCNDELKRRKTNRRRKNPPRLHLRLSFRSILRRKSRNKTERNRTKSGGWDNRPRRRRRPRLKKP